MGIFAALGAGFLTLAANAAEESAADTGPKDHIIFLGLDVTVEQPEGVAQVQGVSRGDVEIAVGGATRKMPVRRLGNFTTALAPKVSGAAVTLSKVKAERIYSPGRDPGRQAALEQARMLSLQGELAERQHAKEEKLANTMTIAGSTKADPASVAARRGAQQELPTLQKDVASGMNLLSIDPMRVAEINSGSAGTYDELEVTFELSSEEVLDDAYAIMLTLVQHPDNPNVPQRVVAFENLPRITPKARKVRIVQRGLPPGFGFTAYQIHVYAKGHEIATNLSSQRADVSKIEAFQFLFFQHLSNHLGEFLPPTIATDLLETDLRGRVSEKDRSRTVDVTVTADGQVTKVVLGQATSTKANDEYLERFISESIFFPALAAGKPVDGNTTVFLGDFVR